MRSSLRSVLRIFPPVAALLCQISCVSPHGVRMQDVDPSGWNVSHPITVAYENTDTLSRREIRTVIRLERDFAYDRLNFKLTTITPNGLRWRDTITVFTRDPLQNRNGYEELEQTYRRNVILNQHGRYLFTFTPVMPDLRTENVTAAGINIVPDRMN